MILKTINNTVKIKTTTIENGDMGFSFLSNLSNSNLVRRSYFSLNDKTLKAINRCLQNPYNKRDCLRQRVFILLQLNEAENF